MSQIVFSSIPQTVTGTTIGGFNSAVVALPGSTYVSGTGQTRVNVLGVSNGIYNQRWQVNQQTSDYLGIWRGVVVKLGFQRLPGHGLRSIRG